MVRRKYIGEMEYYSSPHAFHCFMWKIDNFFNLPMEEGCAMKSPIFFFENNRYCLKILPTGSEYKNNKGWFGLKLERIDRNGTFSCNISLGVQGHNGKNIKCCSGKTNLSGDFQEIKFMELAEMLSRHTEISSNGCLKVFCEIHNEERRPSTEHQPLSCIGGTSVGVSKDGDNKNMEIDPHFARSLLTLSEHLRNLFLNGQNYDVIINVKGKEFQAHRAILCARSDVFAPMFIHNMTEKNNGVINVEDCDPEAFQEFLHFLYTGKLQNLTVKNMLDLYYAADKYNILDLKLICVAFMRHAISADIICDIIEFAVKYGESELLQCATDYFIENVKTVVVSVKWQIFMKNHTTMANELFIKSLKNLAV